MPKSKSLYPAEFRAEAIWMVRTSGQPHAQIAHELGLPPRRCADGSSRMISLPAGPAQRRDDHTGAG